MMAQMDGNWVAQAEVARVLVHGGRAWIRFRLAGMGFSPLHIHCWFSGYRPNPLLTSGWEKAAKLTCMIRQYVTGP